MRRSPRTRRPCQPRARRRAFPTGYALIQGDVLARAFKDAAVAGKIKVIRSSGIGNEAVFAIMNDKIFERSCGSWGAVARHAKQVRFATRSRESFPAPPCRRFIW